MSGFKSEDSNAYEFLSSLSVFSKLSSSELKTLASSARFSSLAAGQYINNEGDEQGLSGFIVVSGRIAMMKNSIGGKEFVVELLTSGDLFALLLKLSFELLPLQLSARAQSKSTILWLPIQTLTALLELHPRIYQELVAHLLLCLQSSYAISRGLAHDRVEVRIASILTSLALKYSRQPSLVDDYTIDITRQQLADLTGTTSESAIRVTREMQRNKLIDISRPGVILVLDMEGLMALAEL